MGHIRDGMIVCDCGTIHPEASELLRSRTEDIENLERELRVKRSQIKRLQKEQQEALRASQQFEPAMRVLEKWRELCAPGARELESRSRLEPVIARLRGGYTEAELVRAIEGYAAFPNVLNGRRVTHGGTRYVDAELIFRDPKHVDSGIALADRTMQYSTVLSGTGPAPTVIEPPDLGALGDAALRYVQKGWLIFPCQAGAKPPMTRNGLLDASGDPEKIIKFWTSHPTANVAVRTGKESGIVVLDVDGDEGIASLRALEKQHGPLPTTASVVTPRGGEHYYFQHPGEDIMNTQGVPGPGLDIRGDGGYVLAPPSIVNGRGYEVDDSVPIVPMPQWFARLLFDHQKKSDGKVDPEVWEKMVAKGVREGERNGSLTRLAGYLMHHIPDRGVGLGLLKNTNRERCSPPLSDREVEKIWESLHRKEERDARRS